MLRSMRPFLLMTDMSHSRASAGSALRGREWSQIGPAAGTSSIFGNRQKQEFECFPVSWFFFSRYTNVLSNA